MSIYVEGDIVRVSPYSAFSQVAPDHVNEAGRVTRVDNFRYPVLVEDPIRYRARHEELLPYD